MQANPDVDSQGLAGLPNVGGTCDGPGDRDSLSLTPRELLAAFADNGVVSVREGEDELVRLGDLSGLDDLGFQCLDRDKVPLVKMRHTETFADAPWHTAMPADERSTASRSDLIQFVEQSLGIDEIRRIEAFGKPVVDSLKKLSGFLPPALIFP